MEKDRNMTMGEQDYIINSFYLDESGNCSINGADIKIRGYKVERSVDEIPMVTITLPCDIVHIADEV